MYSGGLDSMLSCIRLINAGFKVYLIHYNNGSIIGTENIQEGIKQLEKKYGDKIEYIGIGNTTGIFRNYRRINDIENMTAREIAEKYGELSVSQYRCLVCRMSMYTYTIALAKVKNIRYIAEGARKSQLFGIEQPELVEEFKKLCNKYDIKLLLPVYELTKDNEREAEILMNGLEPIQYESKCLLGYPISQPLNNTELTDLKLIYQQLIFEQFKDIDDQNFQQLLKRTRHPKDKIIWY